MFPSFVQPEKGSLTRSCSFNTRSRNSCVGRCSSCTQSTSGVKSERNLSNAGARAGQRSVSQRLQVMNESRDGTIFCDCSQRTNTETSLLGPRESGVQLHV